MRIRHAELEECRSDPRGWVDDQLHPSPGHPRASYSYVIRLGIYRYHKTYDRSDAVSHTERLFDDSFTHLTNADRVLRSVDRLIAYIDWFEREGPTVADTRVDLSVVLSDDVELRGRIHRVDLVPGGYRALLLKAAPEDWRSQLRMPVIQIAAAETFGRAPTDFAVGFQEPDGTGLTTESFSEGELDSAWREVTDLAQELERYRVQILDSE